MPTLLPRAGDAQYFIVNVTHTLRENQFITLLRPKLTGFTWSVPDAGRYPDELVRRHLYFYNSGENLAVPCELLERLAVLSKLLGHGDADAVLRIENNRANWAALLAGAIETPAVRPSPEFKGARRRVALAA